MKRAYGSTAAFAWRRRVNDVQYSYLVASLAWLYRGGDAYVRQIAMETV